MRLLTISGKRVRGVTLKQSGKTKYFDTKGRVSQVDPDLAFGNSGFLHAKSIFTTAAIRNDFLLFGESHLDRIASGGEWLFSGGEGFIPIKEEVRRVIIDSYDEIKKSNEGAYWRLRMTLFEDEKKQRQMILAFSPFDFDALSGIELERVQTMNFLYGMDFKSENQKVGDYRMPFLLEERLGHPILFCHEDGRIGEGSHANLLLCDNEGHWITPHLEKSILMGIGIRHGLEDLNLKVREICVDELSHFIGAWFINSLRGPIPINKINDFEFKESKNLCNEVRTVFDKNSLKRGFEL